MDDRSAKATHIRQLGPEPDRELSVLIIDDEPGIRRLLTLGLNKAGMRVQAICGPEELEDGLQESGEVDLVLLDRTLRSCSGKTLVPELRSRVPEAKLVFFSGEPVDSEEAILVDGVIPKPIRHDALARAIRKFCEGRAR